MAAKKVPTPKKRGRPRKVAPTILAKLNALQGEFKSRVAMASKAGMPLTKADGWFNAFSGVGTNRDRNQFGTFHHDNRLTDQQIVALYDGDDIAQKVVDMVPEESMRRGYNVAIHDNAALSVKIEKEIRDKQYNQKLMEGQKEGRKFGGALNIIGADDGRLQEQPLDIDNIKKIYYINLVDRRFITVWKYYEDPLSENYGLPEIYNISGTVSAPNSLVHESRCIRWEGPDTDAVTRRNLGSWTYSVLQRPYNILRRFSMAFESAGTLLDDACQGVFKIRGLFDTVASGNIDNLQARMALVDMSRSSIRALMLDAEAGEDFHRESAQFSSIPELLDRYMMRMSAACETPVSLLMGRSPAGMNATGDADFRYWYGRIKSWQTNDLEPRIRRFLTIILSAKDSVTSGEVPDFEICFKPLWEPTEKEQAETRYLTAQADNLYYQMTALFPEEIAINRFGGPYSIETSIDIKPRQAALKMELEMLKNTPPEPPPQLGPDGKPIPQDTPTNPGTPAAKKNAGKKTKPA